MGILSGGPNSGFSGKAGSFVGYYRLGKWVIRGIPRLSAKNKKGSPDQKVSRSRFTQVQSFLKHIMPFIRIGFHLEARRKGNTAHNSASSWNLLNAFNDNGELDYSKTRVSSGILEGAQNASAQHVDGKIIFTWDDNSSYTDSGKRIVPEWLDQVMLLAYQVKYPSMVMISSGARRSAGSDSLEIPGVKGEWHTWIAFVSDDRQYISNSEYLGIVNI
ncbi:DUF6266 family protein [Daejeonella lutea]|uniref:Uncharacterized protein n=1 Tax=Daejeonella lutea TaxID=572036 RepID=A0A1T5A7P5_9SPHI|nr:DUF6266 family protein [Daejeonella lutea]SKB30948.1 hypothetical protein SAMN05661099_0410 [Daejeonella lutea]